MPPTDRELMVAFQEGDPEAFDRLHARYRLPLKNYFYKMSYGDAGLAEDLLQETFLRLVRHKAKYRPERPFRTYLFTVARNLFIDHYRSKKAAPPAVSADLRLGDEGSTIGDLLVSREQDTVRRLEGTEAAEMVREAVQELPESQREVFLLVFFQELKYREVAEIMGVPVGTVKSRVNAAFTRLRGRLGHVIG